METKVQPRRLGSMVSVDFRRMFTMPMVYIMMGVSLVMPILILVMTAMVGGSQPGSEASPDLFTNTWQAIGSPRGGGMMAMDLTSMCNINMLYFLIAVLVAVFTAADFRSGYAKNLFSVRANRADYVFSKTLVCFAGGVLMLLSYFVGAMLGGAIAGLPFDTGDAGAAGIAMCMLAKLCLTMVFVAIDLAVCLAAKQKLWLSILGSLMAGMLLYTMVPMMTPLDSGPMNVILCAAGGAMFGAGLGVVGKLILNRTSLV